ncbi:MAG: hypothetical protein ACKN81_16790 [Pirellulaceae bacterium]
MNQQTLRQAAIALGALDPQAARKLLHTLPSDLARTIRRELAHLGPVSPQERLEAMEAWRAFTPLADSSVPESNGDEFPSPPTPQTSPSVAPLIHEPLSPGPIPPTLSEERQPAEPPQLASDHFRWKEEDLPWLAKQLTEQPPWIVSAIMRLLPANISGYLLHSFPRNLWSRHWSDCLIPICRIQTLLACSPTHYVPWKPLLSRFPIGRSWPYLNRPKRWDRTRWRQALAFLHLGICASGSFWRSRHPKSSNRWQRYRGMRDRMQLLILRCRFFRNERPSPSSHRQANCQAYCQAIGTPARHPDNQALAMAPSAWIPPPCRSPNCYRFPIPTYSK